MDTGKVYTKGLSFRARAEARQRAYRASKPGVDWDSERYGHFLNKKAADAGNNFVSPEAFHAAQSRGADGKGVGKRTFDNMLSSQAMCFNLFAPLAKDKVLAAEALSRFIPGLSAVNSLNIEYTPEREVFNDQSGRGGVDCDVLIDGIRDNGQSIVIALETKFVETEFSICGFRKSGRVSKGRAVCQNNVSVASNNHNCLYVSEKGYLYWEQAIKHNLLATRALPQIGCPFAGPLWQLWVNHTLAHIEATRRGATKAMFVVCAPSQNEELLHDGQILGRFRDLLRSPDSLVFIDLDKLISTLHEIVSVQRPQLSEWVTNLTARYANI